MALLRRHGPTQGRRSAPDEAGLPDAAASEAGIALAFAAEQAGEVATRLKEMMWALDVERLKDAGTEPDTRRPLELVAAYVRQLHDQATELSTRIGAARRELRLPETSASPPSFSATRPPGQPERPAARAPRKRPLSKGMRILITQMRAAGIPRVEIEERLRDDFGMRDPQAVVDHVLDGSEAPSGDE